MIRHLDYPPDTPVSELGPAALDSILDRGDLADWTPIAKAVRSDPSGSVASTVLRLCDVHTMYGTSSLWRAWIERLRAGLHGRSGLAPLRSRRGLTQEDVARRLGTTQSDVSKLERRSDVRLSTLRSYAEATGGRLVIRVIYPDGAEVEL